MRVHGFRTVPTVLRSAAGDPSRSRRHLTQIGTYRKIRECKRKTSLFFYHVILILYVSSKIFRFPGSNPKPLYVWANGIPGQKWSLYVLPKKKIRHLGIKIDWGGKCYLQCIRANGKLVNFKYIIAQIFHINWDFWKSPTTWPLAIAVAANWGNYKA